MPGYLRSIAEVGGPVRGDAYGRCLGFWLTEFGTASYEVFHLWEHDDLNARQEARAKLFSLPAWRDKVLPLVEPSIEEQEVRLMVPITEVFAPQNRGHVYEIRFFRAQVGKAQRLAWAVRDELPIDAEGFQKVGTWTTIAGDPNEIVHIAAYRDLFDRMRKTISHPDWIGFMTRHGPLIREMRSSLVVPASHSPMQ